MGTLCLWKSIVCSETQRMLLLTSTPLPSRALQLVLGMFSGASCGKTIFRHTCLQMWIFYELEARAIHKLSIHAYICILDNLSTRKAYFSLWWAIRVCAFITMRHLPSQVTQMLDYANTNPSTDHLLSRIDTRERFPLSYSSLTYKAFKTTDCESLQSLREGHNGGQLSA